MYYHKQLLEVEIFDETFYKRICKVSEETAEPIEKIVDLIVSAGLNYHMNNNLKYIFEKRTQQND